MFSRDFSGKLCQYKYQFVVKLGKIFCQVSGTNTLAYSGAASTTDEKKIFGTIEIWEEEERAKI